MDLRIRDIDITQKEYRERLLNVKKKMRKKEVDVLIVDQVEHIGYLTGYLPTAAMYQACIVPLNEEPLVILRALDERAFIEQSTNQNYVLFNDWENPLQIVIDVFKNKGWEESRLGLELDSNFLFPTRYQYIVNGLPKAQIVDFSKIIWELKLIKSSYEINCLQNAGRIADQSMLSAILKVKEGVLEREVASEVYDAALRLGADNTRMLLMNSGQRLGSYHGQLGNRRLSNGDIVHIETTPHYKGYTARIMRTAIIGTPSQEQEYIANELIRIQDEQFEAIRPGAIASEVDAIAREQIIKSGLVKKYPNTTGYTLGFIYVPRTSDFTRVFLPNSTWRLEEGMVFHMYLGAQGISFSETIVITNDGYDRLTNLDRKIFIN
ncbi:M24 family metallopeptidase [Pseudogracilibacillus sp. SO30301A]|uniref:M24 family metallopeptidase n=1 Tax=Pseudogracilibacillus sp. SO30301A TaxID=3098291 RepID=UPI00300DC4DA